MNARRQRRRRPADDRARRARTTTTPTGRPDGKQHRLGAPELELRRPTAGRASGTSGSRDFVDDGRARRISRTSAWSGRATATGTRPSAGRPTAGASSTPRASDTAVNPELFYCRPARHDGPRSHAADGQPGMGRAGGLHAGHEERDLHVQPRPPGFFNTWRGAGRPRRAAHRRRLHADPADLRGRRSCSRSSRRRTDLYELNLADKRVRRLTHDGDDGWITPEFVWDLPASACCGPRSSGATSCASTSPATPPRRPAGGEPGLRAAERSRRATPTTAARTPTCAAGPGSGVTCADRNI